MLVTPEGGLEAHCVKQHHAVEEVSRLLKLYQILCQAEDVIYDPQPDTTVRFLVFLNITIMTEPVMLYKFQL
ncbi:unnamed protein product [Sphagnum jensenii]|jgi:hypothetical protein|uniref:Uncharacterized protein n=1 Tax=Sphagnum jensenii TaxID=128206 RepID=A0ABP0VXC8_9BRYO